MNKPNIDRTALSQRVGLLATGSEIVNGEITNTNGQKMAEKLLDAGFKVGEHLIVDDQIENLIVAFQFLWLRHGAVITTGGLGPTADDRTRDAISQVLERPLQYSEQSWQKIVTRVSHKYDSIPEANRRQAYFPKGAVRYPNLNGTADACLIEVANKQAFMLPGPPKECLPLFDERVLPALQNSALPQNQKLYRWRLTGIPESQLAELLEPIANVHGIEIAYRASFPHIDVKLQGDEFDPEIIQKIEKITAPYLA